MNLPGHMKKCMVIDLFNPDNKRYCCGKKAEVQRFAEKWQMLIRSPILGEDEIERTKNIIQHRWDQDNKLPRVILQPNGELFLEWNE